MQNETGNLVLTDETPAPGPAQFAVRALVALVFLAGVWYYADHLAVDNVGHIFLVVAALAGAYMAMNIGANDVANNVGPAVGSGAMTLGVAVVIAAIFEAAGALIAGGDVVSTIKDGIIDPSKLDTQVFIWMMMAALLGGAIWLNVATWMGAPVSTTHSIVGGVLGAGLAAGGAGIANWGSMGAIAASWVISPVMGGVIAAVLLFVIKHLIMYPEDMVKAARKVVPWIIALMAWAFVTYLMLKGVKKIFPVGFGTACLIGLVAAAIALFASRASIARVAGSMPNSREAVNNLFTIPLIFSAALLSFAHGANDVANAIGPLAAVTDAVLEGGVTDKAKIPLWVMLVGAIGISIGLILYGPRLIRTVGSEITELDKSRAFCIAMAAAITVIVASQLGLPVSSTHIALGGVFGVGFLREYLKTNYASQLHMILNNHSGEDRERIKAFLDNFKGSDLEDMKSLLLEAKMRKTEVPLTKAERKRLKKIYKHEMVKRHQFLKIAAAWVITVPVSASLGALLFFTMRGIFVQ
ncbi:MAG: anion permease [Gammaproteobacteria bacterium]